MDADQLARFLGKSFPGSSPHEFALGPGGERIGGTLLWEGFNDLSHIDRQNLLWEKLREHFPREELKSISIILAFTPDEMEAMRANP